MSSAEQPAYFSEDEYLSIESQALTKSEYVDGWIRGMVGATLRHNRVKLNCLVQLAKKLQNHPCQPFDSDTKLRIHSPGRRRFYYPDVQVVCESNDPTSVFQDHPVLIIEVLSPSTRRYDLDEKLAAYLSISSLECYIILEQHQPIAVVMRRTSAGFLRETVEGVDKKIDLAFLGCTLDMREMYRGVDFTEDCVQEPEVEYDVG